MWQWTEFNTDSCFFEFLILEVAAVSAVLWRYIMYIMYIKYYHNKTPELDVRLVKPLMTICFCYSIRGERIETLDLSVSSFPQHQPALFIGDVLVPRLRLSRSLSDSDAKFAAILPCCLQQMLHEMI